MLFSLFCVLAWLPETMAQKAAGDYYVHSLPGQPEGPLLKMHAGHIEVTPEHHGNLFFWHFQNRHLADRSRTVIWLNGGPGCSSEDGALMEIGPYRVRKGGKLEYNDGSWDEFANVLFVDNPVGTGFSYVDTDSYVHELNEMADQFMAFLEKWFKLFPEYMQDDIYIAGESYAGQHIPYIAHHILDRNKDPAKESWNLKGLLIGNGWTSPVDQYLSYLPFAYEEGVIQRGSSQAKVVEQQQAICSKALSDGGGEHVDTSSCEQILQEILRVSQTQDGGRTMCVNMYDVRLTDVYPSCGMNWPPDLETVTPYLRQPEVTRALHVNADKKSGWQECSGAVGSNFRARNSAPAIDLLPGLLEQIPILLFSGAKDLICNHVGTEEMINNMEFNGGKGFEISSGTWAPRRQWTFEGEAAGVWQEARNLTYVTFYNSSHMVPFDYPRRTRDMLDRFMNVDISSIGGTPVDSRIEGEKGPITTVGGHPNSTVAQEAEEEALQKATWHAYYKSGEVALVIVVIAAACWGYFIWRDRRRRAGYQGLRGGDGRGNGGLGGMGLEAMRHKRGQSDRDIEAADFDENELEDLASDGEGNDRKERQREQDREMERDRYDIGEGSSDGGDGERVREKGNR
ncbi:pheromone-processing carboxypeptidase KEX1 [Rhizodiscina lignyota]|uniref:Carboxypeptidase n=1 Tax=Rhizodiscina lignyota TaxID=1504668 RepID=A0A9P4IFL0_9PEZI|nr:pheromone-processing carboxypeptidase KEX1 [Rhizodiscina lignyota]